MVESKNSLGIVEITDDNDANNEKLNCFYFYRQSLWLPIFCLIFIFSLTSVSFNRAVVTQNLQRYFKMLSVWWCCKSSKGMFNEMFTLKSRCIIKWNCSYSTFSSPDLQNVRFVQSSIGPRQLVVDWLTTYLRGCTVMGIMDMKEGWPFTWNLNENEEQNSFFLLFLYLLKFA